MGHPLHRSFLVSCFAIVFFLWIGVIGPEKVVTIETTAPTTATLEPSVVSPLLMQRIDIGEPALHIPMPDPVRGIYLTGWTAGTTKGMTHALSLFGEDSMLNAVVVDIKDATGRLSYEPLDEALAATGIGTKRISNLKGVIDEFHKRNIYVIGRLTVFEDPFFSKLHPEETYKDTRTGLPWTNFKGLTWVRANSDLVRTHVAAIARDAYAQGFDEIQLDYVRFPSDGEMKYLDLSSFTKNKNETMAEFFAALYGELGPLGIPMSADVFGLTMSNDEVGIGQKTTLIAPLVDKLSPMLYPSHFWNGTYGIAVPAAEPYKVIYKSLSDGIAKLDKIGIDKSKLRPWFQDFDLVGVKYTPELVRAQIIAAQDLGIDSWLMWDPRNIYTKEVYMLEDTATVSMEPEVGLEPTTTRLQNGSSTN